MAGSGELKVRGFFRALAAASIMVLGAAWLIMGVSCAEGDEDSPGAVSDLNYFWQADALVWNGRVSAGSALGPADTRLLAWTAPGDDDYDGQSSLYDLRFVTVSDTFASEVCL